MSTAPKFGKRGAEAVRPQGSFSGNTKFFSIGDGESEVVRFLTDFDAWPSFLQHQNIPTRAKPADFKGDGWPSNMPAPCRKDPQFEGAYEDCYICDVLSHQIDKYKKPGQRYWALGVLREAVKEDGKIVGYKDKTVTYTKKNEDGSDGEEVVAKDIVVFNMGWKNFFATLDGYGSMNGTVLDRDYTIVRKGEKLETTYTIMPMDRIPGFDLRDDETIAKYLPNAAQIGGQAASDERIGEIIGERASDDYYQLFFGGGTGGATSKPENIPADGPDTQVSTPVTDASPELVSSLVDRIQGYPKGAAASAPEPELVSSGIRNFD